MAGLVRYGNDLIFISTSEFLHEKRNDAKHQSFANMKITSPAKLDPVGSRSCGLTESGKNSVFFNFMAEGAK